MNPEDETTMKVLEHNKHSEMQAVHRKSSSDIEAMMKTWLGTAPFPGLGVMDLRISAGAISDFSSAVAALDLAPGDRVLDLGAGSCWVSDLLNRMLIDTVSLDISLDMLRIGRRRLTQGAMLTEADAERLPFESGLFDGAIFVSSLHHMPDIPKVLREVYRVLKPDGRVVMSEPGLGHSEAPQSKVEKQELGVMERDIIVTELLDMCLQIGFQDVHVYQNFYPPHSYDSNTWRAIQQVTFPEPDSILQALRRRFPRLTRMLFGESPPRAGHLPLCWQILSSTRTAIEVHPLVMARKGTRAFDTRRPHVLDAEIALVNGPSQVTPGASFVLRVRVKNTGDTLWLSQLTQYGGFVTLGAKLVDADNLLLDQEYGRCYLPGDVAPGATALLDITLTAPADPGEYRVKLDMVDECVSWFEHVGATPLFILLNVQ